jgi:hypothetical protein
MARDVARAKRLRYLRYAANDDLPAVLRAA